MSQLTLLLGFLLAAAAGLAIGWFWSGQKWRVRTVAAEVRLAEADAQWRQRFSELEQARAQQISLDELITPVRTTLDQLTARVWEQERDRQVSHGKLAAEVRQVSDQSREVLRETTKVVSALADTGTRGRWGEVHLERVVEAAGLVEGVSYRRQATTVGSDGVLRPDMIVELGGGRQIVIDAKVPLSALWQEDPADRVSEGSGTWAGPEVSQRTYPSGAQAAAHTKALKDRVKELSSKDYQRQFTAAPDFVVLYLPAESLLGLALRQDPDLLESSFTKGVVIATPTTLLSLLRVVAIGWRQQESATNADEILRLSQLLVERLSLVAKRLGTMGTRLESTLAAYNELIGGWQGRVQPTMQRIQDRGLDTGEQAELAELATPVRRLPTAEAG